MSAALKGRRVELTEAQITAAIATFKTGGITMKALAASYGISARTLTRHFKKRGVGAQPDPKLQQEIAAQAASEARRALIGGDPLEYAKKVYETREQSRKGGAFVHRWALKIATDHMQKPNSRPAELINDLKAIHILSAILKNAQDIQTEALGIGTDLNFDDDTLPELPIKVMDDDDVKRVREATDTLGDDLALPAPLIPEIPTPEDENVIEGEDDPAKS